MPAWTTTSLSVSEVNTLVTVVSTIVSYCMALMLAAVSLEIRRLMVIRGEKDAIIQDDGFRTMWKAFGTSKTRGLTFWAMFPVLLGWVASTVINFATSGVSASVEHVEGDEVWVLGLAGRGFVEHDISFPSIADITADVLSEEGVFSTGYLTLLSPELASVGFNSSFSGYEVVPTYLVGSDGEEGVFVHGNEYEPPLDVSMDFCVEIEDLTDGVFSIVPCREGLKVDRTTRTFSVVSLSSEQGTAFAHYVTIGDCSDLYVDIPLGNQGVDIVTRNLTLFDTGAEIYATCSSIYESVIESCVWKDSGVLYFGDWQIAGAGNCTDVSGNAAITVVGIEYEAEVEQGKDAASFLSAMTAETFSGTGKLSSIQQFTEILGAVVRLETMMWGVQIAYDPKEVVEIGISLWIPLVLLLAFILPGVAWGVLRCRSGSSFFLPVSPAEWSACAAREIQMVEGETGGIGKPRDEHYDQLYAFGPEVDDKYGGVSQRLGWVGKHTVSPEMSTL